jgi:hypothetical protein
VLERDNWLDLARKLDRELSYLSEQAHANPMCTVWRLGMLPLSRFDARRRPPA